MARTPPPPATTPPPTLLPYQLRWIQDDAMVKVIEKSRRIGISYAEAADCALLAARTDGMDCWYVGYNKDMSREFIGDVAFWATAFSHAASAIQEGVIRDEGKDILTYTVRFASGFKVTALSSRPTELRGKGGKVVIDEAAFHDDMEGLLKAALAFLVWGGRVAVISSHNGEDSEFNELIREIRADKGGRGRYSLHRVTFDDALADGLYRRIAETRGISWSQEGEDAWRQEIIAFYGEGADEELFVIPSGTREAYLPRVLVEPCTRPEIPVLRWSCEDAFAGKEVDLRHRVTLDWCREHIDPLLIGVDPHLAWAVGEDFARNGDLTAVVPLQEQRDLSLRALCVIELRNVPFKQQEQVLFHLLDRLPNLRAVALDARGNGQYLAEVAAERYGSCVHQVMLTAEWYRQHMPAYQAVFSDRRILLPRDADIINDHRQVKVRKGVPSIPEGSRRKGVDGGQRHGDTAIAGCLAVFAARQESSWGGVPYTLPRPTPRFLRGY